MLQKRPAGRQKRLQSAVFDLTSAVQSPYIPSVKYVSGLCRTYAANSGRRFRCAAQAWMAHGSCSWYSGEGMLDRFKFGEAAPGRFENRAVSSLIAVLLAFVMVLSPLAPATPAMAAGLGDFFGRFSGESENALAQQGKKDVKIAVVSDTHYYPAGRFLRPILGRKRERSRAAGEEGRQDRGRIGYALLSAQLRERLR